VATATPTRRTAACAAAFVVVLSTVGLGASACGGGDDESATTATTEETSTPTTTGGATSEAGRDVFVANCASCHTLTAAGTSGTVGPNLDQIGLMAEDVENQVRNGGGGMPAFEGQLSDDEIAQVAAYVAANDDS
jgi:cytochrome c551